MEPKAVERMLEASPASGVVGLATAVWLPSLSPGTPGPEASAYLDESSSPEDLVSAVHTAAHGSLTPKTRF